MDTECFLFVITQPAIYSRQRGKAVGDLIVSGV